MTPSARILPLRSAPISVGTVENIACTWPAIRSTIAVPMALYGTWTMLMPAFILNISIESCGEVPTPADA